MTTTAERAAAGDEDYQDDRAYQERYYRPRRWPWFLALGLVLALAGGAAYVVYQTDMFAVRQVAVHGSDGSLAKKVQQSADDQLGQPLVSVDTDAVRDKVAKIPQVASVTVIKDWPNVLTIAVTPRVPVATTSANGKWWLLDADGLPYISVKDRPAGLPAIELATPGVDDPATDAALSVVQALPKKVAGIVKKVTAASPYEVKLVLTQNRTVIWGDSADSEQKAAVLPAVLKQPGSVYDLSDPSMVTVK